MTSKKVGSSPLASLIQQWCNSQQQQSNVNNSNSKRRSYHILLQSTQSLQTRIQAADTVGHPQLQVYQRAGVRTPAETATRDMLGGLAWLQHLILLAQRTNSSTSSGTSADNNNCHVILVRTQTRHQASTFNHNGKHTTVVDVSRDPWGWDDDKDEEDASLSLMDLHKLSQAIRKAISNINNNNDNNKNSSSSNDNTQTPIILVWESLTPLFLVHGFAKTLRFVSKSFQHVLQIWSVRTETLTTRQHAQLEDAAQALLYLHGGEMTLMRQGIRETGNIVRESLPFRLVKSKEGSSSSSSSTHSYRLVEEDDAPVKKKPIETLLEPGAGIASTAALDLAMNPTTNITGSSSNNRNKNKITLKMEEDEDEDERKTPVPSHRPRIFLQDDDPEFDDLDEEDPDDDLDI